MFFVHYMKKCTILYCRYVSLVLPRLTALLPLCSVSVLVPATARAGLDQCGPTTRHTRLHRGDCVALPTGVADRAGAGAECAVRGMEVVQDGAAL